MADPDFGTVLLVVLPVVTLTGLVSCVAYAPQLGQAIPALMGSLQLPGFEWPTSPAWLYQLNQGLHVVLGLVVIPVVLAKLWSVTPKLFNGRRRALWRRPSNGCRCCFWPAVSCSSWGNQVRDFANVRDIAGANVAAIEPVGGTGKG